MRLGRCSVRSPGFVDGERIVREERFLPPTEENRRYTGERIVRVDRFRDILVAQPPDLW